MLRLSHFSPTSPASLSQLLSQITYARGNSDLHFRLNKLDPLLNIAFCLYLVLLDQHRSDELVHLIVFRELRKLFGHLFVFSELRIELLAGFYRRLKGCRAAGREGGGERGDQLL